MCRLDFTDVDEDCVGSLCGLTREVFATRRRPRFTPDRTRMKPNPASGQNQINFFVLLTVFSARHAQIFSAPKRNSFRSLRIRLDLFRGRSRLATTKEGPTDGVAIPRMTTAFSRSVCLAICLIRGIATPSVGIILIYVQ